MKTRERILHKSLELFNELGEPNVTTLLISDELEISPGNLYYHFKSKTEILSELFSWYDKEIMRLLEAPDEGMDIEDQWFFLHLVFETIAKYRFLYKDVVNIMQRYDVIQRRFEQIVTTKGRACLSILTSLRDQGRIEANDAELESLRHNIVLVSTFWLNYAFVTNESDEEEVLSKGVYQVMSLVVPYLEGEQRELLEQLRTAYL